MKSKQIHKGLYYHARQNQAVYDATAAWIPLNPTQIVVGGRTQARQGREVVVRMASHEIQLNAGFTKHMAIMEIHCFAKDYTVASDMCDDMAKYFNNKTWLDAEYDLHEYKPTGTMLWPTDEDDFQAVLTVEVRVIV